MEYYELYANQEDARCCNNRLASVVVFDDDSQTIVKWCGDVRSTAIHQSLRNFMKISVTGDRFLVHYTNRNIYHSQVKLDERGNETYDNSITTKW